MKCNNISGTIIIKRSTAEIAKGAYEIQNTISKQYTKPTATANFSLQAGAGVIENLDYII